jgi:FAD/FMN-containing dehydrogenase
VRATRTTIITNRQCRVKEAMLPIDRLRSNFRGKLLQPADPDYDGARRIHNGLIDKRPSLIAQCRGAEDIAATLSYARDLSLPVSVRGGGHNVGGRAVVDGGVMIDLSLARDVSVDPVARTAVAEGGATWADFNRATQQHGLATTGGVISSTGVAGLTLGGGLGWLMALHGMAVDNLIGAEVVTADGRIVTVSAKEHPDLFWALRGGGGNFGVAAKLTFKLHPMGQVVGGLVAHPLDRGAEMLRFFRQTTASAPDELSLFAGLLHAPDGSGAKLGAMIAFHPDADGGLGAVAPVRAFGPPIMDMIGPMPYEQLNSMLDGGFPKGALNYWKSAFLDALSDEAIDTLVQCFRGCPAPMGALLLEHFHGAVTRVPVTDTAFPHREAGHNLLIVSQWLDPAQSDECIAWARRTHELMRPFMAAGRYVNYLGDDEVDDAVAAAYGPNLARLRQVKKAYDPTNMFRLNQNIRPA